MTSRHRQYEEGMKKIEKDHDVTPRVANDVLYLRKQPQWSQPLEDKFIADAKTGTIPDVTQVGKTS